MVLNIERHGDDDQYSNDELVKYKKIIKDSKKHARMIVFYIVGPRTKTLRNALFVASTDSIIEKTAVMTRTATETKEKGGPKKMF
jgi:GTP-dependent phosphoenolpyruvate carboxykinase